MQEGPREFLSTGLPTAAGDENPGTLRNHADCDLLTFDTWSTKGSNADNPGFRCRCANGGSGN